MLILASASPLPAVKVRETSLTELCDMSVTIVVGKVERIVETPMPGGGQESPSIFGQLGPTVPIAELVVERTLRGAVDLQRVRFLAAATWTCDTSSATVGERMLVFLTPWERFDESIRDKGVETRPAAAPIRQVAWSGRGKLTIVRDANGTECFQVMPDVLMPSALRWNDEEAKLDRVLEYVTALERFGPAITAVRVGGWRGTRSPDRPNDETFDLRVLPDGAYRLALGGTEAESVRTGNIDPAALTALASTLQPMDAYTGARKIEGFRGWPRARWMSVNVNGVRFEDQVSPGMYAEDKAREPAFLRRWAAARALVPEVACMGADDP